MSGRIAILANAHLRAQQPVARMQRAQNGHQAKVEAVLQRDERLPERQLPQTLCSESALVLRRKLGCVSLEKIGLSFGRPFK